MSETEKHIKIVGNTVCIDKTSMRALLFWASGMSGKFKSGSYRERFESVFNELEILLNKSTAKKWKWKE